MIYTKEQIEDEAFNGPENDVLRAMLRQLLEENEALKAAHSKLHGDIMNIQCAPRGVEHGFISHDYKAGHRDARHAAAELAANAAGGV